MSKITNDLNIRTYFAIVNSEIFVWDAFERALQDAGIPVSPPRYFPLFYITQSPMRLQELAACLHTKESAASRLVERMVKDGLLMKERDRNDGRAILLRATDKGEHIEQQGREVFAQCLQDLFGSLTAQDMETLRKLLTQAGFVNDERAHD